MANASVNVAIAPDDGRDVPSILRAADVAIYEAKEPGHASLQRFKLSRFIPVAEETGLIVQLGWWTIHPSCRDAAACGATSRLRS